MIKIFKKQKDGCDSRYSSYLVALAEHFCSAQRLGGLLLSSKTDRELSQKLAMRKEVISGLRDSLVTE